MRFNELNLRRYLAWPKLDLRLDEAVSVFVGANGTGKSTILDAARVLVSREARGVPKGGLHVLTTWAHKPFKVEGVVGLFDDDGDFVGSRIRRTATTLSAIDEEGTAITLTEGQLVSTLTRHPKALEAVFDVWKALTMKPADRRALILDLAGDHVQEVTHDFLREAGLTDEGIRDLALAGNWKKAAKQAGDSRRATQANLDGLDLSEPEDPMVGEGDGLPASDVDDQLLKDTRAALAELRQERRLLDEQIGAVKAAPAPTEEVVVEDKRPAHRKAIAELDERLDSQAALTLTTDGAVATNAIVSLQKQVVELDATRQAAESALEAASEDQAAAASALDTAEKSRKPHPCSTCGEEHTAKNVPSDNHMTSLERRLASADEDKREKQVAFDEADEARVDTGAELEVQEEALKVVKRKLEAFVALEKNRNKLRDLVKDLDAAAEEEAEKVASEPEEAEVDLDALQGERDVLSRRIGRGSAMIQAVDDYRERLDALKNRKEKGERLEQRITDLGAQEDLCRSDKPGNIPGLLLADVLIPIRERLARWTGSALWTSEQNREGLQIDGVDLDDDFAPLVIDTAGHRRPVDTINTSAEWRVGFALAASLADLSGLRFLALDEVTYLDGENRAGLLAALLEVKDDFDQILVCAVLAGEVIQPPLEDVRFYLLTESGAERLEDGEVRP